MYLACEVAGPVPFGRQAHHCDGARRRQDAAQRGDVVLHVIEGSVGPQTLMVRAHDRHCYTACGQERACAASAAAEGEAARPNAQAKDWPAPSVRGVSSLERGVPQGASTEGASGRSGKRVDANLSGKADSEGKPTVRAVVCGPSGSCTCPPTCGTPRCIELHVELGAKMVPFAGYEMPVNYPGGILAEHRHCRQSAALFDVSHMGQLRLKGDDARARARDAGAGGRRSTSACSKQRYALFTNCARRHPRRPDDHAARERPAADRQRGLQGSRHAPPRHPPRPALHGGADARACAARAAGAQGGEGAGAPERRRRASSPS